MATRGFWPGAKRTGRTQSSTACWRGADSSHLSLAELDPRPASMGSGVSDNARHGVPADSRGGAGHAGESDPGTATSAFSPLSLPRQGQIKMSLTRSSGHRAKERYGVPHGEAGQQRRSRRSFSEEFKEQTVRLVDEGKPIARVA